ncbi:hypothetical protein K439DRAFT_1646580 [Ramaria rubella]|nr:hypothetical protein K439DRAFT_1646580 [Ramaria rubella]
MTPYGLSQMNKEAESLPPRIVFRKRYVMSHCIEPDTLKNYAAGLIHFTKFCDNFSIPESLRMPASKSLLSSFISMHGAGSVGEGTIRSWLEGLKGWHRINSVPWYGGAELKHGAASFTPASSHMPKRDPVTFQHIIALRRPLDLTNSFNVAVFAMACIVFWSTSITHGTATNGLVYFSFHIPHTKTKPNSDIIILTDSSCSCSPTAAFGHHLSANTCIPGNAPLFAFRTANGGWSPLRRDWFLNRCGSIWTLAGLSSIKGHGFRIGGTTFLLLLGIDPWIIMVQGHWSSQSFLSYWRKCEEILPLFIGFSFQMKSSILDTMSKFHERLLHPP